MYWPDSRSILPDSCFELDDLAGTEDLDVDIVSGSKPVKLRLDLGEGRRD